MKIAIITGASSGLGKEYFMRLKNAKNIDAFWVIARREENLLELKSYTGKEVRAFPLDLSKMESISVLQKELEKENPVVTYLINAAGFGKIRTIASSSVEELNQMMDLNCRATVALTQVVLPYLQKGSSILNIGSVAGFTPLPHFSIYSATKAFVETYTKALHYELKDSGIRITCVCPYWIKDTEFTAKAKDTEDGSYNAYPLASVSKCVVNQSLRDNALNLWVSTPGIVATAGRFLTKIVPDRLAIAILRHWSH